MAIIGWLAPNGIFHKCNSYEHLSIAWDLKKFYFGQTIDVIISINREDEFLFAKGFIKFTYDDVYMFSYHLSKQIELTENQIKFVSENKDISQAQHLKISEHMRINTKMPVKDVFQGDNELVEYQEPRIIHTIEEYPPPTKHIKITTNVPVSAEFKPTVGDIYPVIKEGGKYDLLYFILVNGEEVGIYPNRECEVMNNEQRNII